MHLAVLLLELGDPRLEVPRSALRLRRPLRERFPACKRERLLYWSESTLSS